MYKMRKDVFGLAKQSPELGESKGGYIHMILQVTFEATIYLDSVEDNET